MTARGAELSISLKFIVEDCCNCGMAFAIPEDFRNRLIENHRTFYCPAGHGQNYTGTTEVERLQRKLKQAEERAMAIRAEADQAWALADERGKESKAKDKEIRRITKRANAGQCLQCKRHFVNVEAHVKRQHPECSPSHLGDHKPLRGEYKRA